MARGQSFDEEAAQTLTNWAQRASRRSVLNRLGKLTLWVAGVSLAPLLPLNRAIAQGSCSDWRLCGIYGALCSTSCCSSSGSLTNCPNCLSQGSYWSSCCCTGSCPTICRMIRYIDCCGAEASCTSNFCANGAEQPAWCGSGQAYRCTIIADVSGC